jgi:uncharacterized repeat protein (TIGR01451 family)
MKKLTRSTRTILTAGLVLAVSLIGHFPAAGQEQDGPLRIVAVNLTAQEEDRPPAAGTTAPISRPGDVIEYRIAFTNTTSGPIQDVVFDDPVPEGLVYVLGSAGAEREDVDVQFSIDGGESYQQSPEIEVQEATGLVRRPAPAERYTHVRWTVTGVVPGGEVVRAVFRARIAGGSS